MKPAICYAVVRAIYGWSRPDRFEILSVTSINTRFQPIFYGRVSGRPTSRANSDVLALCDTLSDAEAAMEAVRKIDAAARPDIEATEAKLKRLKAERTQAILDALQSYRSPRHKTPGLPSL